MPFAFTCWRHSVFIGLNTLPYFFSTSLHSSWLHLLFCHFRLGVFNLALSALRLEVTAHTRLQWRTSGSLPDAQPLRPRSLKNANPKDPTHTQKAGGLHVEGKFSISFPSEHISQPMFSSAIRTPPFTSFWGQRELIYRITPSWYLKHYIGKVLGFFLIRQCWSKPISSFLHFRVPHTAPGRCSPLLESTCCQVYLSSKRSTQFPVSCRTGYFNLCLGIRFCC